MQCCRLEITHRTSPVAVIVFALLHPRDTMDPGRQQLEIDLNDNNSAYTLITTDSSLETKSNLPGPGRNLGNLYSCLGKKFENILSAIAVWVGRGPRQTATKMRVLVQEDGPRKPSYNRKLERLGERLVKYAR